MSNSSNANISEIVGSEFRQQPEINRVVLERLFVAIEPQTNQPSRDVQLPPAIFGWAILSCNISQIKTSQLPDVTFSLKRYFDRYRDPEPSDLLVRLSAMGQTRSTNGLWHRGCEVSDSSTRSLS